MHVSRGAVGMSSMTLGFIALGFLPLPEAMMIGYAAPLMVVILAAFMLGETVRLFRWTAVTVGFVGIVIILWPRLTVFGSGVSSAAFIGSLAALCGAFCSAFAAIFIRGLGPRLTPLGVAGALTNPVLSLHDASDARLAANDDWDPALAPLAARTGAAGLPLDPGSRDACLLVTLNPGSYTAIVSGVDNSTGEALVEIYEVP